MKALRDYVHGNSIIFTACTEIVTNKFFKKEFTGFKNATTSDTDIAGCNCTSSIDINFKQ